MGCDKALSQSYASGSTTTTATTAIAATAAAANTISVQFQLRAKTIQLLLECALVRLKDATGGRTDSLLHNARARLLVQQPPPC